MSWWRHEMETLSALFCVIRICCWANSRVTGDLSHCNTVMNTMQNRSPVPGEFPAQRPVTRNFDVFFDLRLIKQLSKQSRGWSFETLSHPLWRHRNGGRQRWWSLITPRCARVPKRIWPLAYNEGNHQLKSLNFVEYWPIFTIESSHPNIFFFRKLLKIANTLLDLAGGIMAFVLMARYSYWLH